MKLFRRVVVLGLDAMDIGLVFQLVREQKVPALASLIDASVWSTTVVPPGLVVGSIWPSITTGVWPDTHGFYCDQQIATGTYEARHRGPEDITTTRVWEGLSDAGLRCAVLDVPLTAPSSRLRGVQLVEWGAHDRFSEPLSVPPEFLDEVLATVGTYPVQPKCDDYVHGSRLADLRTDLLEGIAARERLYTRFLERTDDNLFFGVFGESHCAAHQFWANHDPAHPRHDPDLRAALGDVLVEVYEAIDAAVGRLLATVPADVPVVAIWSHGAGPHYDGGHILSEILRRLDSADGGTRPVIDFRERAIRLLQRPGRRARSALPLDSACRFFKVPNNDLYGGIRVNLRGREPRGRVHPGSDHENVIAELSASLLELRDPATGNPIVGRVMRVDELYDGPLRDHLPDLFVDWIRDRPIDGATSPRIGTVQRTAGTPRTGDHRPRGLVAFRVPGITPGTFAEPVPVVDIAPTISALLGVDLHDVDGRPVDFATVGSGRRLGDVLDPG